MKSLEQELRDGNYDIHDVLNDETSERRVFLARMGRDVEALAGTLESDVLVALIENGYAEDYYDDWFFHVSSNVRKALAHKGYYPERFIHDPSSVVRMAVIDAYPDMVTTLLSDGNTENWRHIYDRVLEKREPEVMSVDNQAQKMARKLLTGEVTMSDIEPDLQKTGNPTIDTQIDEFRYLLAHYYEQFLNNGF